MSDEPLPLDDYEAVNLLWLLRVASRLGLDTGDWCHQLTFKLEARPNSLRGPNSSPKDTEWRIEHIADRNIAIRLREAEFKLSTAQAEVGRIKAAANRLVDATGHCTSCRDCGDGPCCDCCDVAAAVAALATGEEKGNG